VGRAAPCIWLLKRCVPSSVLILITFVTSRALADDDYYRALAYAERATATAQLAPALRVVEAALQKYPGDYELTLARGNLELRSMRYRAAEQSFRSAVAISDGSIAARLGLGWALLHQHACAQALIEFENVLARADHPSARSGLAQCKAQVNPYGSAWFTVGGALFQEHPWKRRYGDFSAGLTLQKSGVTFGLAYHQLHLTATDRRVADVDQRELYMQVGAATQSLLLLGHAAMVWSADPRSDGSVHAGLSVRYSSVEQLLSEISAELTVSRYPDLWIGRAASAWRFAWKSWAVTPSIGVTKHLLEYLTAASVTLGKSFGALSLWVSCKYGPEYRAAFLSQFALLNSEDRSVWSLSAGLRAALTDELALLANYFFLVMRTPDLLPARMQLMNVGAAFSF